MYRTAVFKNERRVLHGTLDAAGLLIGRVDESRGVDAAAAVRIGFSIGIGLEKLSIHNRIIN